ncbi:MAG: hypothetical protein LQ346_000244 [Caloplaca aetnensis]|nr:MAG: hypothetical protein LQ346_000244 [Caloplaca aetnensis]
MPGIAYVVLSFRALCSAVMTKGSGMVVCCPVGVTIFWLQGKQPIVATVRRSKCHSHRQLSCPHGHVGRLGRVELDMVVKLAKKNSLSTLAFDVFLRRRVPAGRGFPGGNIIYLSILQEMPRYEGRFTRFWVQPFDMLRKEIGTRIRKGAKRT